MYNTKQMTYRARHGYKAFASTFLSYIPSEKLRYGNSLWCADGSGTLAYSYLDKEGKLRSMRLYIIMVSDVATGKIVGGSCIGRATQGNPRNGTRGGPDGTARLR